MNADVFGDGFHMKLYRNNHSEEEHSVLPPNRLGKRLCHPAVRRIGVEKLEGRRLFSSGGLDPTYAGGAGTHIVTPGGGDFLVVAVDHRLGRTIVLGATDPNYNVGSPTGGTARVAAFDSAGNLDPTFGGGDGVAELPQVSFPNDVFVGPDGKIVVAGAIAGVGGVARLTASGALDTTFSGDGLAPLPGTDRASAVRVGDVGGAVVVGGVASIPQPGGTGTATVFAAARLTAAGAFDASFGGTGVVVTAVVGGASGVAVQTNGAIVLTGTVPPMPFGGASDIGVLRLSAAGTLDPSFGGGDGVLQFDFSDDDFGGPLDLTPDGKILVGLTYSELIGTAARLNTDGTLDVFASTFDTVTGGYRTQVTDVRSSFDGTQFYVFTESDNFSRAPASIVYRYDADGSLDHTFGPAGQGYIRSDTETFGDLTADGQLVLVGNAVSTSSDLTLLDASRVQVTRRLTVTTTADRIGLTADGILYVEGTAGADAISVAPAAGGKVIGKLNGQPASFPASAVKYVEISGSAGNDTIIASALAANVMVTANGGAGNDTITTGASNDTLDGGDGNDVLVAGAGQNYLFGGAGDDKLTGGVGGDGLRGGAGNDRLDGGLGADSLGGGDGTDTLDYGSRGNPLDIDLGTCKAGEVGEQDYAFPDVEIVIGGRGNDTIQGNWLNNIFYGNAGDDLLVGRGGNDTLDAGPGRDRLYGSDGDDTLYAADGGTADYADGGSGYDKARKDAKDAVFAIEAFI